MGLGISSCNSQPDDWSAQYCEGQPCNSNSKTIQHSGKFSRDNVRDCPSTVIKAAGFQGNVAVRTDYLKEGSCEIRPNSQTSPPTSS